MFVLSLIFFCQCMLALSNQAFHTFMQEKEQQKITRGLAGRFLKINVSNERVVKLANCFLIRELCRLVLYLRARLLRRCKKHYSPYSRFLSQFIRERVIATDNNSIRYSNNIDSFLIGREVDKMTFVNENETDKKVQLITRFVNHSDSFSASKYAREFYQSV